MKNLVYLGGTFSPVHKGHALALSYSQKMLAADRAFFVPNALPPHKPEPTLKPEHRLKLLQLAATELELDSGQRGVFGVESCELSRSGASYTVKTVEELRNRNPEDRIFWVIGSDNLANLNTWFCWQNIFDWCNLAVVKRSGYSLSKEEDWFSWLKQRECDFNESGTSGSLIMLDTPEIMVSSTQVRDRMRQGLLVDELLTGSVLSYLRQHNIKF